MDTVAARNKGEFAGVRPEDLTLMDVAPNQLVSVAASLIPFLENDDANRALMGSNMQRQAVPGLHRVTLGGTGMERTVARDSGVTTTCRRSGYVEAVDASRIVIKTDDGEEPMRLEGMSTSTTSPSSCAPIRTLCQPATRGGPGSPVEAGEVIADGPATDTRIGPWAKCRGRIHAMARLQL